MIRASIIILCHNAFEEATRPCIESVITNTNIDNNELILVDNASTDDTAVYLESLANKNSNIFVIINEFNKGYAGGNNDGLKIAKGQYIVLLNNDTLVSNGWLDSLLKIFEEQPRIGLVGPVTNSAGNEQQINIKGLNESNFERISGSYTRRQKGQWFITERLGFFCVAMRRRVFEKVGYLDERFGIGMFEDDDYSARVKSNGFFLAIVEYCFVYHKGSISFKKFPLESYQTLFDNNRNYYRSKHGIDWTWTNIALSYLEKIDNDLLSYIKNNEKIAPEIERILVRYKSLSQILVIINNIESSNNLPNNLKTPPQVKRIKWKMRLNNFNRNFFYGTNYEKLLYITTILQKIKIKFIRCFV
jgi:GT2 family glycosyltransferase